MIGIVPARLIEREIMRPIATDTTLLVCQYTIETALMIVYTYVQPSVKSVIKPARLLPASLNIRRNGMGRRSTRMSRAELLTEWPKNMTKKSSGSLLPQPIQRPGRDGLQFFAIGLQENSARKKKVKPHEAQMTIRAQVSRMARRYCAVAVDGADSAKRRRYWKRIESLMKVELAQ